MPGRVRLRIGWGTGSRASDVNAPDCKRFRCSEHAELRVCQVLKVLVVGPFVLEGPEEAFHHGVIVTTAGAAHGALNAQSSQGLLIGVAGVLTAAIAVVKQVPTLWPLGLHGLSQSRADQL